MLKGPPRKVDSADSVTKELNAAAQGATRRGAGQSDTSGACAFFGTTPSYQCRAGPWPGPPPAALISAAGRGPFSDRGVVWLDSNLTTSPDESNTDGHPVLDLHVNDTAR
jgi:hypothetical protein